jgi:hypothetical protein|nr:MAG TPA: hypothetical protein [Caudoviricetes sp.]
MILKRVGVFETNSSSCHSMAYVARLQLAKPSQTQTITQQFGVLGFTPMFNDQSWEVHFTDYVWKEQTLSTPQDKLWFLLMEIYSESLVDEVFGDPFYLHIKQWLSDIGIYLEEIGYDEDDIVESVPTNGVVKQEMFETKEDLYKYLFDNNIVIDVRQYEVMAEY